MNEINIQKGENLHTATGAPDYKLFSSGQIAVATVLGSIITGGLMLASNYAKLGEKKNARRSVLFAVGAFLLFSIIGVLMVINKMSDSDGKTITSMLNVVSIIGFGLMLNRFQGVRYDNHIASGGERTSNWNVAAFVIVISVLYLAAFFLFQMFIGAFM